MKNKWYISIWSEGKHVDFWFFNHFFSGFLLASLLIFLETPYWLNLLLLFLLMVLWEVFEYQHEVRERLSNRIIDLLVGLLGFLFMYLITSFIVLDYTRLFMGTFILFSILEVWGYWAYKKRENNKND
jgi:hypothetical protein